MKAKLSDIAEIIPGYPFKHKMREVSDPQAPVIRVLQIKDITNDNINQPGKLSTTNINTGYKKFLLKKDDLLMSIRGGNYTTARLTHLEEPTIAASQVFIIRCRDKIQPAYLYWFLNLNTTQYKLKQAQTGTSIPMLNKAALADLDVALPAPEIQENIARLQSLWAQQKQTYEHLINNGNLLTQGLCKKLLEP